jgi:hypothetical protein
MDINSEIKAAESLLGSTVSKSSTPWIILAVVLGLFTAGAVGAYLGYHYGTGQAAADKAQMLQAFNTALQQSEARRKDEEVRGTQVVKTFLARLDNIKIVNRTYNSTLQKETEKLVYTDCKVPDSGVDLLNKHITDANLILIQGKKGAQK